MAGLTIGINALRAATYLIEIAGENIANADTPGYHAKRVDLTALADGKGGVQAGSGGHDQNVMRLVNPLLERMLLANVQIRERLAEEIEGLHYVENLVGDMSSGGIDGRLTDFFTSVERLSVRPDDQTLREQVIMKAESVCQILNRVSSQLWATAADVYTAIGDTVGKINRLARGIVGLNQQVKQIETGGGDATGMMDSRDRLISEMAELINVRADVRDFGVATVNIDGTSLADETHATALEVRETENGLRVGIQGVAEYLLSVNEGRLAGLLNTFNDTLPAAGEMLDELANSFRSAVNRVQTTGLGLAGRFEELQGLNNVEGSTPFFALGYGVREGTDERLVINVEEKATGRITQYELRVDTTLSADAFLFSLRDDVNSLVDHVQASAGDGSLHLVADTGYAFGFATPYDPDPADVGEISAPDPAIPRILDAYQGEADLEYRMEFLTGGEVGTDAITVQISVSAPGGGVLRTFTRELGTDYRAGAAIGLENGLKFALGVGNVMAGDSFSFTAHASMDTAGILDALGLNVFLNGIGADGIHVAESVRNDANLLAGSITGAPGDNQRFLDLLEVQSQRILSGGGATLHEYFRSAAAGTGAAIQSKSAQHTNLEEVVRSLENRRDAISSVSVDEQMVALIRARRGYQAATRYIKLLDETLNDLLQLV